MPKQHTALFNPDGSPAFDFAPSPESPPRYGAPVRIYPSIRGYIACAVMAAVICAALAFACFTPDRDVAYRSLFRRVYAASQMGYPQRAAQLLRLMGVPEIASPADDGVRDGGDSGIGQSRAEPDEPLGSALPEISRKEVRISAAQMPDVVRIPAGELPILPRDMSQLIQGSTAVLLNNQTSLAVDMAQIEKMPYPIKAYVPVDGDSGSYGNSSAPIDGNIWHDSTSSAPIDTSDGGVNGHTAPLVLILCTHATESYAENGAVSYDPKTYTARDANPEQNVLAVAAKLRDTLERSGIPCVMSDVQHDARSYTMAYSNALRTIDDYIDRFPSIEYVFDVPRDSITAQNGTKYRPAISVDGQDAAQVMFVVGTSAGGGLHPNWQMNLKCAVSFQREINSMYPALARPINLREPRFNGQTSPGAVIIEAGSCGSGLAEAIYGAELAGEAIARVILGK